MSELFKKQGRRKFIQNTGLTVGGGLLSTGALMGNSLNSGAFSEEKKLGVALVGLGYYATHKIAPALLETKYCELKGIVTGTPSKEKEWIDKYNLSPKSVYNYVNFDDIADNPEIDVVYVVLPNAMHVDYVNRAAQAGKHVMCEKPFDVNAKRAAKGIEACKRYGKLLQIGYRCQHDPYHQELIRVGKSGEMGKIKEIRSAHSFYGVHNKNWRFTNKALAGGGPLMDVGIYSIQAARYASGEEPIAVSARTYNSFKNLMDGMEETIVFTMEFPSGAIANITSSYVARANYVDVSAEKGNYGLGPAFGYDGAQGYIGDQKMSFTVGNQQAAQMDAFARNILDGTPVLASGEEGLRDMRIVDAIYKSAKKNGKRIKL